MAAPVVNPLTVKFLYEIFIFISHELLTDVPRNHIIYPCSL